MVFHDCCERLRRPGAVHNPVTQLRVPHKIMAPKVFPMVFRDVDCYLPASKVEHALLGLGGEELHVVCRGDLAENVSVVQNGLVQNVVIFTCSL